MLNRSNMALAVLLLIQIALLGISAISATRTVTAPTGPLLAGFSAAAVERITVADNLDNEVSLARSEEGWVLPNADDFPANAVKIEELLGKITDLNTGRLIASSSSSLARLEVGDDKFQRRLNMVTDSASESLYLGGSGGVDAVYVRRGGDSHVYLGVGLNTWEAPTQVSMWIDTSYVNVPQEDVLGITLNNAHGRFSFRRDGETWVYAGLGEGETFDTARMANILRNAASVRMTEPLGLEARDAYGLDDPAVTVEVLHREALEVESAAAEADEAAGETEAGIEYVERSYTLAIGAQQDGGDYALKSPANDYYVLARQTVADAFADVSHETLVTDGESE